MKLRLVLIVCLLVVLDAASARADGYDHTLCCSVDTLSCTLLATQVDPITGTNACPAPSPSGPTWQVAVPVTASSVGEGAEIVWEQGEPPGGFGGVCLTALTDLSFDLPLFCIDFTSLGRNVILTSGIGVLETYASNPALTPAQMGYLQGVVACIPNFSGGSCPVSYSHVGNSTCCTRTDQSTAMAASGSLAYQVSAPVYYWPAIPKPQLSNGNGLGAPKVGQPYRFIVQNGEIGRPILLTTFAGSTAISQGLNIGTVANAPFTAVMGPAWTTSGPWHAWVTIDGANSNVMPLSVVGPPSAVPAWPHGVAGLCALGLGAVGLVFARRRRGAMSS